ncbi:MAG TPA: molecular chaperone DnaJ, partial [Rhizobiales bacterium]|nr:molecular chaperone DnaJ [Hyphomicrobiales bacterium]
MATKRDYYEILGCVKTADGKTLKSAYRKLAMKYHPDRNPDDPEAEARFKEINEAYSVLSDEQKRAAYDRMGHSAFSQSGGGGGGAGFHDFSDIFSQIFGNQGGFADMFGGGGGRQQRRSVRGSDLRYELEITLEEAFSGKDLEIKIPISEDCHACSGTGAAQGARVETCSTCGGVGRVRTQQGFFTMERPCPRCGGQGEYVSDPCRTCDGTGQVRVETALEVNIPAGVEDGTRIRLAGQGDAPPKAAGPGGQRG